jgi:hypothetical protein
MMKYLCDDCGKELSLKDAITPTVFVSPASDKPGHPGYRIEVKVRVVGLPMYVCMCKDCLTKRLLEVLK